MTDRRLLVGWTLLLYASAGLVRPAAQALRERGVLAPTVWLLSALGCAFIVWILRRREEPLPTGALVVSALAGAWLALHWKLPEERIHLAQYAPVGVLAWGAVSGRLGPALLLGAALGLGDELVQAAMPSRTFDPWDVFANAVAATAGVLLSAGGRVAWLAPVVLLAARLLLGLMHAGHPGVPADPLSAPQVSPKAPASTASDGPSVLFLSVDALRADRVPPWGEAAVPTPALDALAADSLAVDAHANALWTTPSMVSLFTGLLPPTHGVEGRGQELAPGVVTPLDRLVEAGWRVVGHAGDATETYRNLGFQAEIDRSRPAHEVVVEELSKGRTFLWLHLREVHAPYDATPERLAELGLPTPPASPLLDRARTGFTVPRADFPGDHGWLKPYLSALYDAEVGDADRTLGRILAALEQAELNPWIVLTADHGEELLERGGVGHASTTLNSQPWEELVEIPLLLRFPDRRGAGTRATGSLQQIDVLPTLLPLLGVSGGPAASDVPLDGRSFADPVSSGRGLRTGAGDDAVLVHSSPCGWQCPDARRNERVTALWSGDWLRCAADGCPPPIQSRLDAARARGEALGTPVASPP